MDTEGGRRRTLFGDLLDNSEGMDVFAADKTPRNVPNLRSPARLENAIH